MLHVLASRAPRAKDSADCGLRGSRIGSLRVEDFAASDTRSPLSLADSESARETAQNAPLGS
eukprot:7803851-Alexandrium_andersonii.AAC.1